MEEHGVAPNGQLIDVPLHQHKVSLDFTRMEFEYDHTFKDNWDVWLRVPYEIKRRSSSIGLLGAADAAEREAMEKNRRIHHPDRTLTGLSDLRLLLAHRRLSLLREGDGLDIGFGASIPTGNTEEDPFKAGDAGFEHEHVQFGTGTFDPLLELHYTAPLSPALTLSASGVGRFPFYENGKTYRAPMEITSMLTLLYAWKPRLTLRSTLSGYYQAFARWDGARDINSGLRAWNVSLGATFTTRRGIALSLGLRKPVVQETLDKSGDAFEQGPSLLLFVSHSIRPDGSGSP